MPDVKVERDWEDERHKLMALILKKTRLCIFGGGAGGERTSCVFGSPGCACDDEVWALVERGYLEEPEQPE